MPLEKNDSIPSKDKQVDLLEILQNEGKYYEDRYCLAKTWTAASVSRGYIYFKIKGIAEYVGNFSNNNLGTKTTYHLVKAYCSETDKTNRCLLVVTQRPSASNVLKGR